MKIGSWVFFLEESNIIFQKTSTWFLVYLRFRFLNSSCHLGRQRQRHYLKLRILYKNEAQVQFYLTTIIFLSFSVVLLLVVWFFRQLHIVSLLSCLCIALLTLLRCSSCIVAFLFSCYYVCSVYITISLFSCYYLYSSRIFVSLFSQCCLILLTLPFLLLFIDLQVLTGLAFDAILFTLSLFYSHYYCLYLLGWYGTSPPFLAMCQLKLEHQVFEHQRGLFIILFLFLFFGFEFFFIHFVLFLLIMC